MVGLVFPYYSCFSEFSRQPSFISSIKRLVSTSYDAALPNQKHKHTFLFVQVFLNLGSVYIYLYIYILFPVFLCLKYFKTEKYNLVDQENNFLFI